VAGIGITGTHSIVIKNPSPRRRGSKSNNSRAAAWTRVTYWAVSPSVRVTPSGTITIHTDSVNGNILLKSELNSLQHNNSLKLICVKQLRLLTGMWWTVIDSDDRCHLNIW